MDQKHGETSVVELKVVKSIPVKWEQFNGLYRVIFPHFRFDIDRTLKWTIRTKDFEWIYLSPEPAKSVEEAKRLCLEKWKQLTTIEVAE